MRQAISKPRVQRKKYQPGDLITCTLRHSNYETRLVQEAQYL